jgi:hypothetical protein
VNARAFYLLLAIAGSGAASCGDNPEASAGTAPEPATLIAPLQINFQPGWIAPVGDYKIDRGESFADRGHGLSYGWNVTHTESARYFQPPFPSLDVKLWTVVEMAGGSETKWEVAVPNGWYQVTVVAGGPQTTTRQRVTAEGMSIIDEYVGEYAPWVKAVAEVSVDDGRLTLTNTEGAGGTRLCYVDIVAL